MENNAVMVTGLGTINALGLSGEQTWQRLCDQRTGIGTLTLFASPQAYPVAQVASLPLLSPILQEQVRPRTRTEHLGLYAACQAFEQAALETLTADQRTRIGVVMGTSTGGMFSSETLYRHYLLEQQLPSELSLLCDHSALALAEKIAKGLKLGGPCLAVMTACSSGANALACAYDLIVSGQSDIVLAGGVDCLTQLTYQGFMSLRLLAPHACQPFDRHRAGLNLGEAGAVLVLESKQSAQARGASAYAQLVGYGNSADAYHATQPHPRGQGAIAAMRQALAQARVAPAQIDYINAHGTATPHNDRIEALAIQEVFAPHQPWVSSSKGALGHTLGAAGALEALITVQALWQQCLPPCVGLRHPDPRCPLRFVTSALPCSCSYALSNSFAFGGNNTTLIFQVAD